MAVLMARVHVAAIGLGGSLRRYWKRLAVGAFAGWLLSSVVGAFLLVWLEFQGLVSYETSPLLGAVIVWSGTGLGAIVAYAMKHDERTQVPEPVPARVHTRR